MIPFLFPFSRGLLFPLVALDKIAAMFPHLSTDDVLFLAWCVWISHCSTGVFTEPVQQSHYISPSFFSWYCLAC